MKRFLATASHDLQSPLRHIAMYAEILLDELRAKLDDEQRESLTAILQKAQGAQRLTKVLMSFAAGTPQLSPAPLELGGLIESVWAEVTSETAAQDAILSHVTLPTIHSDATILSAVLKHILGNALIYRSAAAPHVEVTAESSAGVWLLHISDNGRGVEPAYQERIFEPFWKLPQAGGVPGAGLGLTAARELSAAMGGDVTLTRSDETGSCFTIRLPAAWPHQIE